MKKFLALAVAVMMLVGMMSLTASAHRGYTYNSTYGTPVIDGVIDDIWANSVKCELQFFNNDGWLADQERVGVPVSNYSFRVMNDDQYIYVLAEVYDYTPGDMDYVEFHVDEDFCQKTNAEFEENPCPYNYQLRVPVWEPDDFSYGNGYMGPGTINPDGSYKDVCPEMKSTVQRITTSEGSCNYGILEFKIQTVLPFDQIVNIGIETSYQDFDEDCEWVNFHRWNCDTMREDDVPFGWPAGESDDDGRNWPYCSTICYAPFYMASAPAEEPASEEPASEAEEPASEEPASEEPASEAPASEEPASEPATQGGNTKPPKTADAGIVVAAVVMAAAAAVVLNKKH